MAVSSTFVNWFKISYFLLIPLYRVPNYLLILGNVSAKAFFLEASVVFPVDYNGFNDIFMLTESW